MLLCKTHSDFSPHMQGILFFGQPFAAAINSNIQRSRKLNQLQIFPYLGHVLGIRHNKHSRGRLLVNGHDVPAERKQELANISLGPSRREGSR